MERPGDFETRREHLKSLSESELEQRFWDLAAGITRPLVETARTHTSPSIERSVLLRMGFSSVESKAIVEGCLDRGLLGKGAGHVVLKLSRHLEEDIRDTGLALADGRFWDEVQTLFQEAAK